MASASASCLSTSSGRKAAAMRIRRQARSATAAAVSTARVTASAQLRTVENDREGAAAGC